MSLFEESALTHSTAAPEFYTWTFPGAPVRILLQLNIVDLMAYEVKRAFEDVRAHGVEIGGLLLGTAFVSSRIIEIKGFEPFPSAYRTDHKFILSDSDRHKLERRLAAGQGDRSDGLDVVGFYRSHFGEGLGLSQSDVSLAQKYFKNPTNVFLLVKPATNGPANAGFFFWDKGWIDAKFSYLEFPFDARQLSGVFEQSASRSHPHWFWYMLFGAVMIAAGAASFGTYMKWGAPATAGNVASDSPAVALQVERRGTDLRVIWDRQSLAVSRASEGVLVIRDGDLTERQIHLDLEQLRHGSILYSPANPTVHFRLEITDAENVKTSQTVLALTAPRLDASVSARQTGAVPEDNRAPGSRQPQTDSTPPSQIPPAAAPSTRDFGEPARVTRVDPPAQLPGKEAPNTASKRVPESPQPKLTPPLPQPNLAAASYIPARPMHEVQPTLSPGASTEASVMEVEMRVHIDDKGRVVKAEPLPTKEPVSNSFVGAARNAALQWQFEPAWRGTRPVASESVLKFRYDSKRVPESPQPKLALPLAQANLAASSYTPPRPMREFQPMPRASTEITSLMEVEIRVHIDDKGRVLKAEPLPTKEPVSSSLVAAARKAALHWQFAPARLGDRPVASESVLKFQYHPAEPSSGLPR